MSIANVCFTLRGDVHERTLVSGGAGWNYAFGISFVCQVDKVDRHSRLL